MAFSRSLCPPMVVAPSVTTKEEVKRAALLTLTDPASYEDIKVLRSHANLHREALQRHLKRSNHVDNMGVLLPRFPIRATDDIPQAVVDLTYVCGHPELVCTIARLCVCVVEPHPMVVVRWNPNTFCG